jgi:hypothetical protein
MDASVRSGVTATLRPWLLAKAKGNGFILVLVSVRIFTWFYLGSTNVTVPGRNNKGVDNESKPLISDILYV